MMIWLAIEINPEGPNCGDCNYLDVGVITFNPEFSYKCRLFAVNLEKVRVKRMVEIEEKVVRCRECLEAEQ